MIDFSHFKLSNNRIFSDRINSRAKHFNNFNKLRVLDQKKIAQIFNSISSFLNHLPKDKLKKHWKPIAITGTVGAASGIALAALKLWNNDQTTPPEISIQPVQQLFQSFPFHNNSLFEESINNTGTCFLPKIIPEATNVNNTKMCPLQATVFLNTTIVNNTESCPLPPAVPNTTSVNNAEFCPVSLMSRNISTIIGVNLVAAKDNALAPIDTPAFVLPVKDDISTEETHELFIGDEIESQVNNYKLFDDTEVHFYDSDDIPQPFLSTTQKKSSTSIFKLDWIEDLWMKRHEIKDTVVSIGKVVSSIFGIVGGCVRVYRWIYPNQEYPQHFSNTASMPLEQSPRMISSQGTNRKKGQKKARRYIDPTLHDMMNTLQEIQKNQRQQNHHTTQPHLEYASADHKEEKHDPSRSLDPVLSQIIPIDVHQMHIPVPAVEPTKPEEKKDENINVDQIPVPALFQPTVTNSNIDGKKSFNLDQPEEDEDLSTSEEAGASQEVKDASKESESTDNENNGKYVFVDPFSDLHTVTDLQNPSSNNSEWTCTIS